MTLSRRSALRAITLAAGGTLLHACARPRPERRGPAVHAAPRPTPDEPVLRLPYGAAPQQFGELRLPRLAGPHPVVIVLHGGFWQAAHGLDLMAPVCEALRAQGLASWNVEYRRIGQPGGGWPGTLLDVAAAADHLRTLAPRHQLELGRVTTLGHSAGGQLSLWLAGRRWIRTGALSAPKPLRVQAAVALAGVVDLRRAWEMGMDPVAQLMGGSPDEVPDRYGCASPAELLPLGVPQVLLHGRRDPVVPATLSAEYQAAAIRRGDDARLVSLDGIGHWELIEPTTQAWSTAAAALVDLV